MKRVATRRDAEIVIFNDVRIWTRSSVPFDLLSAWTIWKIGRFLAENARQFAAFKGNFLAKL